MRFYSHARLVCVTTGNTDARDELRSRGERSTTRSGGGTGIPMEGGARHRKLRRAAALQDAGWLGDQQSFGVLFSDGEELEGGLAGGGACPAPNCARRWR